MLKVTLSGDGECSILHTPTGVTVDTSKSPAYGGLGRSFSSTDLLAAALGSCIATDIEPVAIRHGVPLDRITIEVDKRLSVKPRRIDAFDVRVTVTAAIREDVAARLRRAAHACLVQRSLDPAIACTVTLEARPAD